MFDARQWLRALLITALMMTTGAVHVAHAASAKSASTDYKIAPTPAWVKPITADPALAARPLPPGAKARRNVLIDTQVQLTGPKPVVWQHTMGTALDSSTLREVSEPAIAFNPSYQTLAIHAVNVWRNGKRGDRLKDVRIETMRREQSLERQMLDGIHTALVMLNDVRVGDVVEVAYSLEGANPIFEGKYSDLFPAGDEAAIDRLHIRIEAPMTRELHVKGIAMDATIERLQEAGRQVLRFQRQDIPPVRAEGGTPPWFKVYPALHVSEYKNWKDVDQWAQGLFPQEPPTGELARRIADWKAKGLAPDALLSEVLTFVQDDIRYFSMSLGESSHRPKPAARTLAERMGDCKDKVLLLGTLLKGLGFEARPTLVSVFRNRGVAQFLPSHDQFDHVISMVELDGQRYFLDATLQGQGRTLRSRGYHPYGVGLVVGRGDALQRVDAPGFAQDSLSYQQNWDISDLKRPAQLTVRMTARGLAAERWRAAIAGNGLDRLSQSIAGGYIRAFPGLQTPAQPQLNDNRDTNELEIVHRFEHPQFGQYKRGLLELDLINIETGEVLGLPTEARRATPLMLDQPRTLEVRLGLRAPRSLSMPPPPPQQITDKHFAFSIRTEVKDNEITMRSRYDRRGDEVLPGDLDGFRDKVMLARQNTGQTLRLLLIDRSGLEPMARSVGARTARFAARPDALLRLVRDQEAERQMADAVLPLLAPGSPLALKVQGDRAILNNMLGDFQSGLRDAEAVLASTPASTQAMEARGVALMGLNRSTDAGKDFEQLLRGHGQPGSALWLAISQYMQGDYGKAENTLKQQLADTTGDERTFALIWLHLAADRQQAGKGRTAVANELAGVDDKNWPGVLLHHLAGGASRDALMRMTSEEPEQERLRMAETGFFIGQQLLIQGKPDEARGWFERAVRTQALPYREVSLSQIELVKLGGPVIVGDAGMGAGYGPGADAPFGKLLKDIGKGLGQILKQLDRP